MHHCLAAFCEGWMLNLNFAMIESQATPGAPDGGMQTSWLMKAKEANLNKLS